MDTLKFVALAVLAWASGCATAAGSADIAGNAAAGKVAFDAQLGLMALLPLHGVPGVACH